MKELFNLFSYEWNLIKKNHVYHTNKRKKNEKNDVNLDVINFGAEDVKNDARLRSSGRTVATNDPLAETDTLISQDKLVKNILAVMDAILDDSFFFRMTTLYESVEDGNTVSQTRAPDHYGFWIDAIKHCAFQDGQAHILLQIGTIGITDFIVLN